MHAFGIAIIALSVSTAQAGKRLLAWPYYNGGPDGLDPSKFNTGSSNTVAIYDWETYQPPSTNGNGGLEFIGMQAVSARCFWYLDCHSQLLFAIVPRFLFFPGQPTRGTPGGPRLEKWVFDQPSSTVTVVGLLALYSCILPERARSQWDFPRSGGCCERYYSLLLLNSLPTFRSSVVQATL